jgi:hypothetical protein
MIILDRLIDRVGDSNPQIFRELKERLTFRNIGIVLIAVLLIQVFVLIYFNNQIPLPHYTNYSPHTKIAEAYSKYCTALSRELANVCQLDGINNFKINWQIWWTDVFVCLNWILAMGLTLGSVYTLVADLIQEEKRGTLNFIRLSPQSAQKIFVGKILGVPILVYLGVALMLPLHLILGLSIGASIPFLASWYLMISSIWLLLASAAILYVLLGGIQAILTTAVVGWPMFFASKALNELAIETIEQKGWSPKVLSWFGISITNNAISFYAFVAVSCLIVSLGIWQSIERRYLNPAATAISKSQSYLANLCLQIWIAGFAISVIYRHDTYTTEQSISWFAAMDFMALLLSIPMLLPGKQSIQDWSRYRLERGAAKTRKFWRSELIQDLIVNDHSPTLLAIMINIGIAMALWVPLSIFAFRTPGYGLKFLAGICLAASLTLIYAAIAHLVLFFKVKKRNLWIFIIIGSAMILPLGGAIVLSPFQAGSPSGFAALLLLFSPFAPIGILALSGGTLLAAFAAQLAVLGILTRQLQRQLKISGQSQTKELFSRR